MPRFRDRGGLFAILLLAAALRLYGIGHGLPFVYNPDEANIMARALSVARSLDPEYYLYPSFFFYFVFAVMGGLFVVGRILGRYGDLSAFEARFFEDPADFYLAGRLSVVLLALATIVILERLVSKHFGKVAGRAAAFFTAVAYFHARDSHYLKHDVPAGFLVVAFLWATDRAISRKSLSGYLLAGVVLGIAFATHYYLIFLAPAFVLCHLAYRGREDFSRVVAAGAASAATFFLLSPFVFLRFPTALEHMRANRQVVVDRSLSAGSGLFPSLGLYLEFALEQGLGYILSALVLVGFFLLARRHRRSLALWAAFPLMFLAFISYTFFAGRYLNPILPCLAASAGVAAEEPAEERGERRDGVTEKHHGAAHLARQRRGERLGRDGPIVPQALEMAGVRPVQRRVDLALLGVEDRADRVGREGQAPRQRVQRRDADQGLPRGEGQALQGADADPEPGERAGPQGDGQPVDLGEGPTRRRQHVVDGREEPLGVGDGEVQAALRHDRVALEQRRSPGERGGLDAEDSHRASLAAAANGRQARPGRPEPPRRPGCPPPAAPQRIGLPSAVRLWRDS